jgi:nicotinamide phosphoribosyltransferase
LNPKVGIIYGDGLETDTINQILAMCQIKGFSAQNLVFGQGGGLLQKVNRDTIKAAFKASAIKINNEWHDIFKEPHSGFSSTIKTSKKGRLALIRDNYEYTTINIDQLEGRENLLIPVFEDGILLKEYDFEEVREA